MTNKPLEKVQIYPSIWPDEEKLAAHVADLQKAWDDAKITPADPIVSELLEAVTKMLFAIDDYGCGFDSRSDFWDGVEKARAVMRKINGE